MFNLQLFFQTNLSLIPQVLRYLFYTISNFTKDIIGKFYTYSSKLFLTPNQKVQFRKFIELCISIRPRRARKNSISNIELRNIFVNKYRQGLFHILYRV